MERAAQLYLAPRQVSVGVSGGISILYYGLRLLLEVHPDFIAVRASSAAAAASYSARTEDALYSSGPPRLEATATVGQ